MKKIKNNQVTKYEFSTAMGGIDRQFKQIDERFEQVDKRFEKIDERFDRLEIKIHEQRIETRELINEFGELMIRKFNELDKIFVTKKEFYGAQTA